MKATRLNFVLILFVVPVVLQAADISKIYKAEKKISKSYNVTSNAALEVNNQYGNIYVTTWDQNKTAIDVVITVGAKNNDTAKNILDNIDVEFSASASRVAASTEISRFSGRNVEIQINYTIKIPTKGSILLNNEYGSIRTGSINGKALLTCLYGDFFIEALNSSNNIINLEYCDNSKIGYLKSGTLSADYSNITITTCNTLTASCDNTNLTVNNLDEIKYSGDYGTLNVLNCKSLTGSGDYTSLDIKSLIGSFIFSGDYSNAVIGVESTLKKIALSGDYTNLTLKIARNYSFDFAVSGDYMTISGLNGAHYTHRYEKDRSILPGIF